MLFIYFNQVFLCILIRKLYRPSITWSKLFLQPAQILSLATLDRMYYALLTNATSSSINTITCYIIAINYSIFIQLIAIIVHLPYYLLMFLIKSHTTHYTLPVKIALGKNQNERRPRARSDPNTSSATRRLSVKYFWIFIVII